MRGKKIDCAWEGVTFCHVILDDFVKIVVPRWRFHYTTVIVDEHNSHADADLNTNYIQHPGFKNLLAFEWAETFCHKQPYEIISACTFS